MSDTHSTDLDAPGLVRDGARIVHFGDWRAEAQAALGADAIFDLAHLALIGVDGEDAIEFLQGQLTNDVSEVDVERAQQSAWCSPKGRVLTCFLVFRHDGQLMLQLPATLVDATLSRMRMYVLRARARLEDASDRWMRVGLVGEQAEACLREHRGPLPESPDDVRARDGVTVIRLRGKRPRYEIVGARDALVPLWDACRAVAVAAGSDAWELLEIEAGVASIGPETRDAFVPQMINLDRIGGVSFTKGCYVGQEIVARTHHLGRIKRRMYRARWDGSASVAAGDSLDASADGTSAKAQIVNARPLPAGGFEVLAVMPIELAEATPAAGLTIGDGSRLTLEPLPYALDDESA